MTGGGARLAALTLAVAAVAVDPRSAVAEPHGAVEATGAVLISGGTPRRRAGLAATAYLTRRLGVRASAGLLTLDPVADRGVATLGITYRAAAARPKLELVVRAEAGVTWHDPAPAAGAGTTAFLWPTRLPLAITFDLGALAIIDGVADSRLAVWLGAGIAFAR